MIEIVKFQLPNCGPCKAIQPTLERVRAEFPEIRFTFVDAATNPDLCSQLQIKSAPTVLIMKDGKETHRFVGAKFRLNDYMQAVESLIEE